MFAICGAYAGNSEQIAKLVETIKNAPAGSITATKYAIFDAYCWEHVVVEKDAKLFLEEYRCSDYHQDTIYRFIIYNGMEKSEISGGHEEFKELITVIDVLKENKQDVNKI